MFAPFPRQVIGVRAWSWAVLAYLFDRGWDASWSGGKLDLNVPKVQDPQGFSGKLVTWNVARHSIRRGGVGTEPGSTADPQIPQ